MNDHSLTLIAFMNDQIYAKTLSIFLKSRGPVINATVS